MQYLFKLSLAFLCFVFLSTATTHAATCLTNEELVFAKDADLEGWKPCNKLGGMYLLGVGRPLFGYDKWSGDVPANLEYYGLVRAYLGAVASAGALKAKNEKVDNYYLLIGALAILENDQSLRYRYYVTYILLEYYHLNKGRISLSKHTLKEVIETFWTDGPLETVTDMKCFIKADLPKFPIEDILKTPRFLECQKESVE